jgi:hypothetical protein
VWRRGAWVRAVVVGAVGMVVGPALLYYFTGDVPVPARGAIPVFPRTATAASRRHLVAGEEPGVRATVNGPTT